MEDLLNKAIEMMHGECKFCKHKPNGPYMLFRGPFGETHPMQFANGVCSTCKYAYKTMALPINNRPIDEDNWEWSGNIE